MAIELPHSFVDGPMACRCDQVFCMVIRGEKSIVILGRDTDEEILPDDEPFIVARMKSPDGNRYNDFIVMTDSKRWGEIGSCDEIARHLRDLDYNHVKKASSHTLTTGDLESIRAMVAAKGMLNG